MSTIPDPPLARICALVTHGVCPKCERELAEGIPADPSYGELFRDAIRTTSTPREAHDRASALYYLHRDTNRDKEQKP